MSVFFIASDGRDVWNPASEAARVFLEQATMMARILGIDSGLGPLVSDEVVIDEARFAKFGSAFAKRMLEYPDGTCFHALMGGCFSVVLGLGCELGLPAPSDDSRVGRYEREGRRLVGTRKDH